MSTPKLDAALTEAESVAKATMPDGHEVTIRNGSLLALIEAVKDNANKRYIEQLVRAISNATANLSDVVRE